jgi:hypothetical protein
MPYAAASSPAQHPLVLLKLDHFVFIIITIYICTILYPFTVGEINDILFYSILFRGEYVCPHCWVQSEKVQSGATLIVSPSSISFQWIEEIQKHVKHKVPRSSITCIVFKYL